MNPLLSFHMPSMRDRKVCNQTYEWSVCYDKHDIAKQSNDIESYFNRCIDPPDYPSTNWLKWHRPKEVNSIAGSLSRCFRCVGSAPPTRSTLQGWPLGVGHDIACNEPPDKPPGYRLLLNRPTDSPDINSKTLNNLNKRNRSLIPKSRERSHRQGGRWGDTNIGDKNHVTKYIN